MEVTVTVQCKCPKCGEEWEEEQHVEVEIEEWRNEGYD